MRPDDLREQVNRRPFKAFRIHLSTGAFFDVRNPRMAKVTRSALHLGLQLEGDQQRFAVIALVHIVWIELLLPAP